MENPRRRAESERREDVLGSFPYTTLPGLRAATSPGWCGGTEGPARPGGLGHRAGAGFFRDGSHAQFRPPAGRRRAQAGKPELRQAASCGVAYSPPGRLQTQQVKAGTRIL